MSQGVLFRESIPEGVHELINVRELSNILENMLLTCGWHNLKDTLSIRDVQAEDKINTPVNIRDYEKQAIINTLNSSNGNIYQAAKILGINKNTLYKKIDMFQIEASPVARVFHSKLQAVSDHPFYNKMNP